MSEPKEFKTPEGNKVVVRRKASQKKEQPKKEQPAPKPFKEEKKAPAPKPTETLDIEKPKAPAPAKEVPTETPPTKSPVVRKPAEAVAPTEKAPTEVMPKDMIISPKGQAIGEAPPREALVKSEPSFEERKQKAADDVVKANNDVIEKFKNLEKQHKQISTALKNELPIKEKMAEQILKRKEALAKKLDRPLQRMTITVEGKPFKDFMYSFLTIASFGGFAEGLRRSIEDDFQKRKAERDSDMAFYDRLSGEYKDATLGVRLHRRDFLQSTKLGMEAAMGANEALKTNVSFMQNFEKVNKQLEREDASINSIKANTAKTEADTAFSKSMEGLNRKAVESKLGLNESTRKLNQAKALEIFMKSQKGGLTEKEFYQTGKAKYDFKSAKRDYDNEARSGIIINKKSGFLMKAGRDSIDKNQKSVSQVRSVKNMIRVQHIVHEAGSRIKKAGLLNITKAQWKDKVYSITKGVLGSAHKDELLADMRSYNHSLKEFIGAAKENLSLDRLSDQDMIIIEKYLGIAEGENGEPNFTSDAFLKLGEALAALDRIVKREKESSHSLGNWRTSDGAIVDEATFFRENYGDIKSPSQLRAEKIDKKINKTAGGSGNLPKELQSRIRDENKQPEVTKK